MKKTCKAVAALVVLAWLPAVWAAGSAVVESGDGNDRKRIGIDYQGDRMRLVAQDPGDMPVQGSMVVRDGAVYIVANGLVIDAGQAMSMFGQSFQAPSTTPNNLGRFVALESTGRTETVAGIGGVVHLLRFEDPDGRPEADEVVLSTDPRVRELAAAMLQMSQILRSSLDVAVSPEEAKAIDAFKGRGVLRYGQEFRLLSISDQPPPASSFELPAQPLRIPSFGGRGAKGGGLDLGAIVDGIKQRRQ